MTTTALTHNVRMGMTAGIWRVDTDGFSAVLKVLSRGSGREAAPWRTSEQPDAWNYWQREALVYEHNLPALYEPSGVGAPRLLALRPRQDGTIALWLEYVPGVRGADWTVPQFGAFARALGRAQGAMASAGARPEYPWLSRRFLREYTTTRGVDRSILESDEVWRTPLVRDHVPSRLRSDVPRLLAERDHFFGVMEALPRTLCHLDVWPNNLFLRDDGTSVLVDWAFAGDGALGEDIGNLIPDSVFDLFLPSRLLPQLEAAVYEGYLRGLHEGGWHGDERLVRLGMCASAVKYEWLLPLMLMQANDAVQLDYGGQRTVGAELRYEERGATLAYLMDWAEEARRLQDELSL